MYSFYKNKKNTTVIGTSLPLTSQNQSQFGIIPAVADINMSHHEYEEIDETNMPDDIQNLDNTPHESETDSNNDSLMQPTVDNEGYLQPYHSLIPSNFEDSIVSDGFNSKTDHQTDNFNQRKSYDRLKIQTKNASTCSDLKSIPTNHGPTETHVDEQEITNQNESAYSLKDENKHAEKQNMQSQDEIAK